MNGMGDFFQLIFYLSTVSLHISRIVPVACQSILHVSTTKKKQFTFWNIDVSAP